MKDSLLHELNIEKALSNVGFDVAAYSDTFIHQCLNTGMQQVGVKSLTAYLPLLRNNQAEQNHLKDLFENHYTEFFRDSLVSSLLERRVFPYLIERKKKLGDVSIRMWSSACSSGQEAYSLAIIWDEIRKKWKPGLQCFLFATDRNQLQLDVAKIGTYSSHAMGQVSLKRIKTYFSYKNDSYWVNTALKSQVDFSVFDLLSKQDSCPVSSIYGNFDLVLCCNILYYYKPEYQASILSKLWESMANESFLIVDASERSIPLQYGFVEWYPDSGIFFKKQTR